MRDQSALTSTSCSNSHPTFLLQMTSKDNRICFINLDYKHSTTNFSFCFLSLYHGWTFLTTNDPTIAPQCLLSQSLSVLSSDSCQSYDLILRLAIPFIQNFLVTSLLDQTHLSSLKNSQHVSGHPSSPSVSRAGPSVFYFVHSQGWGNSWWNYEQNPNNSK